MSHGFPIPKEVRDTTSPPTALIILEALILGTLCPFLADVRRACKPSPARTCARSEVRSHARHLERLDVQLGLIQSLSEVVLAFEKISESTKSRLNQDASTQGCHAPVSSCVRHTQPNQGRVLSNISGFCRFLLLCCCAQSFIESVISPSKIFSSASTQRPAQNHQSSCHNERSDVDDALKWLSARSPQATNRFPA